MKTYPRKEIMINTEILTALLQKAKKQIKQNNDRKRYDINRQWEKIAQFILNIACGWDLEDLNLIRPNFPGIDLGDLSRHTGVQVSTDSSSEKISDTLKKIQNNENNGRRIADDYYNLYFFVPGEKQKSYWTEFHPQPPVQFTTDRIIDFQVFEEMFRGLDEEKQEAILAVLSRELNKKPKYQLSAAPVTTCDFIEGSRQREMEAIDEKFDKSNRVFLWGLGGIGKTELAAEWGLRQEDVYLVHYKRSILDTVLDMDFSGMEYIPSKSGMTDAQKKEEEFRQRLDILREYYQNATIIIDNFDDGETLQYLKERDTLQAGKQNKRQYKEIKRYHHLGELCKKEKQSIEALGYYQKILQIREIYFPQDTGNLMTTYFEIGCIYRDLRQPKEAMPYLEKALMVCESNPDQSPKMHRKNLHKIRKTIEITKGELKNLQNKL